MPTGTQLVSGRARLNPSACLQPLPAPFLGSWAPLFPEVLGQVVPSSPKTYDKWSCHQEIQGAGDMASDSDSNGSFLEAYWPCLQEEKVCVWVCMSPGTPRPSVQERCQRKGSAETSRSCLISRLERIKASIRSPCTHTYTHTPWLGTPRRASCVSPPTLGRP